MKKCLKLFLVLGLLSVQAFAFQKNKLVVYPVDEQIEQMMHNDDYAIQVRTPKGEWQEVFSYNVQVDLDNPQNASLGYFDFEGEVEVKITKKKGSVNTVSIKPLSYDIKNKIKGNTVSFTLKKQQKISVEFNGNKFNNLHLFTNPIETEKPDPNDPNVIYFEPGLHTPKEDPKKVYKIPSGKTVYVAGGAVVRTTFVTSETNNVKLMGRGIIEGSKYGLKIHRSNNIIIQDLIFMNIKSYTVFGGNTNHLKIDNIKSISSSRYSDGIDLMSSNDVVINNVFMRNSDDCLAFYGHRWDYYGGATNYKITNSTLWADVAHPIFIGIHGNPEKVDTISNFKFNNIDIIEHDEDSKIFQGAMGINAGDMAFVKNITFENIRVEDFEEGQLFNVRVVKNRSFNEEPGTGVENIVFKDITYNGNNSSPSVIKGYDEQRKVKNITFDNVMINGQKLKENSPHISIEEYVEQINFR